MLRSLVGSEMCIRDRYDTDNSGRLDRSQLRNLLTDLNEGHDVREPDLDLVIEFSDKGTVKDGQIDKTELVQAIAIWFSNCTPDGDKVPPHEAAATSQQAAQSHSHDSANNDTAPASNCCRVS
eukprot:TRINITY_DN2621_c0_g1_i2.p1 TRINITY_DN2621_c0_g1~~TRINITY_DN2621_c0_g1_i2.p1  ORF type:complete len:123 (+),score=42.74 TRINITY_DN2621_c0_g1_i2:92-460(+)